MRLVLPAIVAACLLLVPQPVRSDTVSSVEGMLAWAYEYRSNPRPERIPEAVHQMRRLGLFARREGAGFFTGFIAGVLAGNPDRAPQLVEGMFPMPHKEQGIVIEAIAYSGLPDWQNLLAAYQDRMPERAPLIEAYLSGEKPTLETLPLAEGAHAVYANWGYYLATGDERAVIRLFPALRWTEMRDRPLFSTERLRTAVGLSEGADIDQLTAGSTAKWSLASHAERDRELLDLYIAHIGDQPPEIARPLHDIIEAAQSFEAERIREEELAALEVAEARERQRGTSQSRAAYAGSAALSAACVVAGATGQVQIAVPCVITGALYSGTVNLLKRGE